MKRFLGILILLTTAILPRIAFAQVTVSETHVNVLCNGGNNGSIDITASGGISPYTYLWSGGAITQDQTSLTAGNYFVIVTDNTGDTATLSITITEPTAMSFSKSITQVYCGGDSTGVIDLTVAGGTPGYTYLWSDGIITEDRINVTAANRYFTVTDANGCTKFDSANVTQPPGMVISSTVTNQICTAPNGAIDLTVSYGVPGYTYLWNDAITTTQDRTGIAAGTYTVTITDVSGCTVSASETVGVSTEAMAINGTSQQPSCFGGNNGTITITSVAGSTGPYTFVWGDGPTIQNRTGLSAGTYTVTTTSSTSCTTSLSFTIGQPTAISVSITAIPVSCNGGSNGAINTTRSGGTAPYSYAWSDGGFTQNRTGRAAGTYTLTVTDFRGCTATATTFISQPIVGLVVTAIPSPLACTGGASGSVAAIPVGGTGPYSYWWGGVNINSVILNVPAGNYCATVTDANGCTANACASIPPYTPLSANISQTDISCVSDSTGSIDLTVTNGRPPYSYMWSDSATTEDLHNLGQGNYTVTVTDGATCTISKTATITQPPFSLTVNATVADVSCFGRNDGSITFNAINGNSPYTYNWGGGTNSPTQTGLSPGSYAVTVTDNSGCSIGSAATVTEPTPLIVNSFSANVACYGDSTGAVNLTATGSFAPYSYNWNDGGDSQNRNNLPAGFYSVLLTDLHGCTASASATVSQPSTPLLVTSTKSDVACYGASTGWINITVTGGTSPYTYDWGGVNTQNRTNLTAGTYTVTVTDSAGCVFTLSTNINQPSAILISSTTTNTACSGVSTGAINLTVSGGSTPYSFDWGNGFVTANRVNLSAGSYTVTVTDSAGCTNTHTATISQISSISVSAIATNASCNGGNNGTITTSASGGTLPYNYIWEDGTTTTQNRSGITAGNYSVTVSDVNSCSTSATSVITEPSPILTSTTTTNPVCFGLSTGSIDLSVNGGTSPYLYSWSNTDTTQDLSNIAAGNYLVNVTDANNCVTSTTTTITQPAQIALSITQVNVPCSGSGSGSIDLTVTGGTAPYSYIWSNTFNTEDISSLAAGTYSVDVSDSNFCSASASATITQVSGVTVNETHTNITCNGINNGSITVTQNGGTSPYTYDWGGGVFTQNRTSLSQGIYAVTVTDNTNCSGSASVTITEPSAIALSEMHTPFACTNSRGAIDLYVNGGTSPYNYIWAHGPVTQDINNLTAGNYSVTVSDSNLCSEMLSVNITSIAPVSSSLTKTDLVCNGTNTGAIDLSLTGGTSPYTYLWSNSRITEDISGLAAGNYSVVVTDANNCTTSNSTVLTQPNSIQISDSVVPIKCYGDSTGAINISVNGGTSPYNFVWNNTAVTEDIFSLRSGSYSLTVTDQNGCSISSNNITVSQPAPLNITSIATPVSCTGRTDGAIDLAVTGGTSPYSYNWDNLLYTRRINNLSTGNYRATVTDVNGCTANTIQSIGTVPEITLLSSVQNTACEQVATGTVHLAVAGGTPPYIFNWNNGSHNEDVNQLAMGSYSVSVTDSRDCSVQDNFDITYEYTLVADATDSAEINIGESIELAVVTNVDHGNMYLWNPANDLTCADCAATSANPLTTTHYFVEVTDTNGCKANDELMLTVNSATDIFIPNAFTPNNDGNNDVLELYGNKAGITFLNFEVFNRWGEKVLETSNPNFKWDGTYKGEPAQNGVYVYVMKAVFTNGYSRDDFKGSITILR